MNMNFTSINDLFNELKKYVKGQDEYCRYLSLLAYKIYKIANDEIDYRLKEIPLVIGATGTGKTFALKCLAKILGINFIIFDSASFSKVGYKGNNIADSIIKKLHIDEDNEPTIFLFDEIDKMKDPYSKDPSAIYTEFLKLLDEDELVYNNSKRSLRNVTFSFAGSFQQYRDNLSNNQTGFFKDTLNKKRNELSIEDLRGLDLPTEFLGRMTKIVQLNQLDESVYEDIIMNGKDNAFNITKIDLSRKGIELKYNAEQLTNYILGKIEERKNDGFGTRVINNTMLQIVNDLYLNLDINNESGKNVNEINIMINGNEIEFELKKEDKYKMHSIDGMNTYLVKNISAEYFKSIENEDINKKNLCELSLEYLDLITTGLYFEDARSKRKRELLDLQEQFHLSNLLKYLTKLTYKNVNVNEYQFRVIDYLIELRTMNKTEKEITRYLSDQYIEVCKKRNCAVELIDV